MFNIFVVLSFVLITVILWNEINKYHKKSLRNSKIVIKEGFGPFATISYGNSSVEALLDTGSLYFLTTENDDSECLLNLPQNIQTYHYAGPSAQFSWGSNNISVGDISFSECIPIGKVPESSASALGLPAVFGLAALPSWATQRFNVESSINFMSSDVWFILQNRGNEMIDFDSEPEQSPGELVISIPTKPFLFSPTPGLGYLTQNIERLSVFFTPQDHFSINRINADDQLSQSNQFTFSITENDLTTKQGVLGAIEWYCLFDTGTFPGIFYADGDTNLLGTRVAQSMVPGQLSNSDFMVASSVIYVFSDIRGKKIPVRANNVIVPKLTPDDLTKTNILMTVCGFDFQSNFNIHYEIDEKIGLPKSVSFYSQNSQNLKENEISERMVPPVLRVLGTHII